uniref:Uncharacterized protein n=1 Tax=Caenorhabditis japonica TaxID=281687 RepID=A0A8R1DEC6_CAEJA
MNRFSTSLLLIVIIIGSTVAIPKSPSYIGVQTTCTRKSIESFCGADQLLCVRSACSQCILRDPFNPFASFCARLTDCVCSISNDAECEQKVEQTCY